MKTLPPAFANHVAGGLTTLCRCWRVDRRDGVVMAIPIFLIMVVMVFVLIAFPETATWLPDNMRHHPGG